MIRILKRMWIPLVLVVVFAVSGLTVMRLHKILASQDLMRCRRRYTDRAVSPEKHGV